jgi:predicted RNA-binding Zn ribbon-like protein
MAEWGGHEVKNALESGRLALDFANTVSMHASAHPVEKLRTYADLVDWAARAGVVDEAGARRLLRRAGQSPAEAEAVRAKAVALREAIYHVLSAEAGGQRPAPADLATLNAGLAESLARARLAAVEPGGYRLGWLDEAGEALDQMLWPVAHAAAEVLTTPAVLQRVGRCADVDGCGWLFIDTSKNHSRRWCDMNDCGNRAKARRHYARAKSG